MSALALRIMRAAVGLGVLMLAGAPVQAEAPLSEKKLKKEIQKTEQEIKKTTKQAARTETQLEEIDRQIARQSSHVMEFRSLTQDLEADLDRLSGEMRSIQSRTAQLQIDLANQVRAAYITGRRPYLKMLLNQEDVAQTGRMLAYFSYFRQAYRHELDESDQLLAQQKQLEETSSAQLEKLRDLSEKAQAQRDKLRELKSDRARALLAYKTRIDHASKKLQNLYEDRKRLSEITRQLAATSRAKERDKPKQLINLSGDWPVSGNLLKRFGEARVASGELKWEGVLIGANEGEPVKAIADGHVVFSDWMRAYGYLTIIDHGNGYMSLYGHNESLSKKKGDDIRRGDIVGYVGMSGGQDQAALYFEIRKQGDPVNPLTWMSAHR